MRASRLLALWIAILLTLSAVAAGVEKAGKPKPPPENPEKPIVRITLQTFADALFHGNPDEARQICVAGKEEEKVIEAMAASFGSIQKLGDAAVARFGKAGEKFGPHESMLHKQLVEGDVLIETDAATVVGTEPPIFLKKTDGVWKMDLVTSNRTGKLTESIQSLTLVRHIAEEAAREIRAGKYKSVDEVQKAMERKVESASAAAAQHR